jgi:hypothetical protein
MEFSVQRLPLRMLFEPGEDQAGMHRSGSRSAWLRRV